jgi:hypothetical protein
MIRPILILVLCAAPLVAGCSPQAEPKAPKVQTLDEFFEQDDLQIVATDGTRHSFTIYLATTYEQQRRGLMFVRQLPERTGMLFVYDDESQHSMWMKNTFIPLDIVFARRDGTVSSVIQNAEPLSLKSLAAIEPVTFVLELNAGVARRYSIGPGSQLIWSPDVD